VKQGVTKQKILEHLRLRPASAAQLARELGLSKVAVYRHLEDLRESGYVRVRTESKGGRGRPLRLYEAIDEPTAYARICNEMLEQIEQLYGPGAGVRVMRARYREQLRRWQSSFEGLPLKERVQRLAEWLTERGYQAESEVRRGELALEQQRCPKLALARGHREICSLEMEFFGELLGVRLERECSIAQGDRCCRYRVVDANETKTQP